MYQLGLTLTIGATLGNRALAATSPHRDTVDDVSLKKTIIINKRGTFLSSVELFDVRHNISENLLGFVSKPARLVRPSWPGSTVHLNNNNCLH